MLDHYTSSVSTFTFQYGEIKSFLHLLIHFPNMQFTFQYGEIKSRTVRRVLCEYSDLHSSMERLKGITAAIGPLLILIFTFQYGEIKSNGDAVMVPVSVLFTFQYGEIKRDDRSVC